MLNPGFGPPRSVHRVVTDRKSQQLPGKSETSFAAETGRPSIYFSGERPVLGSKTWF
jgi:hypothetical protein